MTTSLNDDGPNAPPSERPTSSRLASHLHCEDPLAQVRAYWEGLREGGSIPFRSQFDPRGVEGALSCTFLLERVAPGIARFRIAGMALADIMGMELRGLPVSALFSPDARPQLATALEAVFTGPAVLTMQLEALTGLFKPAFSAQLLVLPLQTDQGGSGLALGCFALSGKVGRSPRRFDVTSQSLLRLSCPATIEPAFKPAAPTPKATPTLTPGFAEARAPFIPPKGSAQRPYLKLVKSDA